MGDSLWDEDWAVSPECRTFTVFLIRHGEACHNVEEKAAKRAALELAMKDGHAADSNEAKRSMEEARRVVLANPDLFDAGLSVKGMEQARAAGDVIREWVEGEGLPPPSAVFVSPLQRTLQTACLVFPDHGNIHVRETLRERLTGRPPDNRMASRHLARRRSFQRFSFDNLIRCSCDHLESLRPQNLEEESTAISFNRYPKLENQGERLPYHSTFNTDLELEDEEKLRERTTKVFELLAESEANSVAFVTHKGFLRGLERGSFRMPSSPEFNNCEVRVYRATFTPGASCLDSVDRLK